MRFSPRVVPCSVRILVCALMLLLSTSATLAAPPADGVVARVAAATEAFRESTGVEGTEDRQAAFRDAAGLYEAALAIGPRNGALEYNAGNAWLLSGDPGQAILHYRRALLIRPGDPRIVANLETARARRSDRFEETSTRALAETFFFWHTGLSLVTKVPLAAISWALAFGFLALGVWLPTGRPGRTGCRRTGALLLLVALAVGVSALIDMDTRAARDAAVVVADEIALRTGDGTSYPERYENPVHSGAEVRVVEERAGWVDVELSDGKRGWVPVEMVERI
jgi:hypothetical protein